MTDLDKFMQKELGRLLDQAYLNDLKSQLEKLILKAKIQELERLANFIDSGAQDAVKELEIEDRINSLREGKDYEIRAF